MEALDQVRQELTDLELLLAACSTGEPARPDDRVLCTALPQQVLTLQLVIHQAVSDVVEQKPHGVEPVQTSDASPLALGPDARALIRNLGTVKPH